MPFTARAILDRLDLEAAIVSGEILNDLLPPREDDRVHGELGKRFVAHFRTQLAAGNYEPQPAEFVRVPKPGFTSRPAAALTLHDRILYRALVGALETSLDGYLVSREIVLWPRAKPERKQWRAFEQAPLLAGATYVVKADVSGYYDSIDHVLLLDQLIHATGEVEIATALSQFLKQVMSVTRGLPQGLSPSDALATTFLQPIDAAMIREGFLYWRHGDDIRIAVPTFARAQESIAVFERELRTQRLLVNSAKCAILLAHGYNQEFANWEEARQRTRDELLEARIVALDHDAQALTSEMRAAGLDEQLEWDLFYHGRISFDEVIEKLRDNLMPGDADVAERVFAELMRKSPDVPGGLPKDQFHQRLSFSLTRLAAGRVPFAIEHTATLMAKFPDETELICRYLSSQIETHQERVVAQLENLLNSDVYATGWQRAWWIRTLLPGVRVAREETIVSLERVATSEAEDWLARVEALKALGASGRLDQQLSRRAWRNCPHVYRPDVLFAVSRMTHTEWARQFMSVAHLDPVHKVIASHATQSSGPDRANRPDAAGPLPPSPPPSVSPETD